MSAPLRTYCVAASTWGWDAPAGSFLRIPTGVTRNFENRGAERAGVLNVFLPGGFEAMMPTIIGYFADQRAGDASE